MSDCIFCKIVAGQIPAKKIFEDEHAIAFFDIAPAAPTHILLIPKQHIASLADLKPENAPLMGHLMSLVPQLAHDQGLTNGFRTIINTGQVGGQEVYHLHIHILGGPNRLPGLVPKQ